MEQHQELEREVKRLKRIAAEWAARLHDLVEERLPAGYEDLPGVAQAAYEACEKWARAERALKTQVESTESRNESCHKSQV